MLDKLFRKSDLKYNKKKKEFKVTMADLGVAKFIALITGSSKEVTVKGRTVTFKVSDETSANEVLDLLTTAKAIK